MRLRFAPLFILPALLCPLLSHADPKIYWLSDPVLPGETVLVQGSELGADATVEFSRVDEPAKMPEGLAFTWIKLPSLQASDSSLKFVLPGYLPRAIYACRITAADGSQSKVTWINAPDAWWVQGDEGDSATAGGWLRVQGKCLLLRGGRAKARLNPENGTPIELESIPDSNAYSLHFALPATLPVGSYTISIHNGSSGAAGWREAGLVRIVAPVAIPKEIFNVLETYGPDAAKQMRNSLIKYNEPVDRTEGVLAALDKAKQNGGGTVFFPAGRYAIKGELRIPDHTVLKGEGEGVVTLWWGTAHFNNDGGSQAGREAVEEQKPPGTLIEGSDFAVEDLSLYLPFQYDQGISATQRFRMQRVRVRVDRYWLVKGRDRSGGPVARLENNFQVTDCDLLGRRDTIASGNYGVISHNRILANKSNTPMGAAENVIIEDNQMVSMDPTAYQNISGVGRNIYYAHNHHESLFVHQADYSFTFDAGQGVYMGKLTSTEENHLTLAADPVFPKWANENHKLWKHACVCILGGAGVGQWRDITSHEGRVWGIDRPFDTPPDANSTVTIFPFNGRALVIGNHFEDANWVNAGYGASTEVIYAENELFRCAEMMNYGLFTHDSFLPSWRVQFLDNHIFEGQTKEATTGNGHKTDVPFPLTSAAIHRRETIEADNSGSIQVGGNLTDVIVEGCTLKNPYSVIKASGPVKGVLFRNNHGQDRSTPTYETAGTEALVLPKTGNGP